MSYVKIHRSLVNHPVWTKERFTNGQAWVDLLLMAGYADRELMMGTTVVPLKQGEVLTSQVKLAERWRWNRKTVARFLAGLQRLNMVRIRSSKGTETGFTLISIVNWGTYQSNENLLSAVHGASNGASDGTSDGTSEYPSGGHSQEGKRKILACDSAPAGPKPSGKKPGKVPNPNVKVLIDHYHTTFMARFQSPPPINGAKAGAIAKQLLAGRTLDEAKWLVTEHLTNPPDFFEGKNLYSLGHVLTSAETLLARRAKLRGETHDS